MAPTASATAVVDATPQRILEFVLDIEQYRRIDGKIVRVTSVEGPDSEGRGFVKLWGRFPWMPPSPDVQEFVLERWSRMTFTGASRQPARLVFDFTGAFDLVPQPDGTTSVTHAYEFEFRRPFRILERLEGWLRNDVQREVDELAAHLG